MKIDVFVSNLNAIALDITPAQRPQRLPVVLTAIEVKAIHDPGKKPARTRRRFATGLRCGLPARRP